ncbi:hypothetical protein [Nostoc sp.]|uniref:hypothetical protein n=1 Tax=Nostoc sp. TaxID=1180 RepID=UPI002FF459A2
MTTITTTAQLKESILASKPTLDSTVLEDICRLTRVHQLKWVPNKDGKNPHYIMSQLSAAKGLDEKDYQKHWADKSNLTGSLKGISLESLPGKAVKLEGAQLAIFKKVYQDIYNESLGKINSLWVGNWEHAYAYLVQGKTSVARDFQTLGAKVIELKVEEEIAQQPIEVVTKHFIYNSGWKKEEYLQRDLCYLASMTPYKLSAEVAVEDYPQSKTETRRFDLVHIQPHKTKGKIVTCYELKKDIITIEDLVMTVHAKRYLQLLKDRYNTDHISLILVAPFGGSAEALEKCQGIDYEGVEIWTVRKFTQLLLEKAKAYHQKDPYFITSILLKENETVQKLLEAPQPPKEIAAPIAKALPINVVQMPVKKKIA